MRDDRAAVPASGRDREPDGGGQFEKIPYNEIYKKLFRWPEMVGDFLRGFIRKKLVRNMDFSTLVHLPSDFVNGNFRERESDVIWQAESEWEGRPCTTVILIEFQSANDFRMARRMLSYTALLLEDFEICRGIRKGGRWPATISIVLYNGSAPWTETSSTARFFYPDVPGDAWETLPVQGYILVDVQRLPEEDLADTGNLAVLWFLVERGKDEKDLCFALDRLEEMFSDGKRRGLYEDIVECAWRLADPRMAAVKGSRPVNSLQEVKKLFSERFAAVREESKNEGIIIGLSQGEAIGQARGEAIGQVRGEAIGRTMGEVSSARTALLDMLEMRFGKVPEAVLEDVGALSDVATIRRLYRQAFSIPSIDDFTRQLAGGR